MSASTSAGNRTSKLFTALAALTVVALIASFVGARDRPLWFFEAAGVLIGLPLLLVTRRRFPVTPLLYCLFFLHALILLAGAHYTYAEVPFGFWLKRTLGLSRNPFDRIGHFAQGFVPAMLLRELLLRTSKLGRGKWLWLLVTASCLGFSAFYELIEWWTAVATHSDAELFLGNQGDPWDTQWDMFSALIGAVTAQCLLGQWHARQPSITTTSQRNRAKRKQSTARWRARRRAWACFAARLRACVRTNHSQRLTGVQRFCGSSS